MKYFGFFVGLSLIIFGVFIHSEKTSARDLPKAYAPLPPELSEIEVEKSNQKKPEEPVTIESIKVPIFIYHSIRPHIPDESYSQDAYDITPELLEKELSYLKNNGYTTVGPSDLESYLKSGTTSPVENPVILSFDDGWRNQYTYAFPLLKKYGLTAIFYIYTNPIDNNSPHFLTWDMVKEMQEAGMLIGSHTLTHPLFREIDVKEAKKEISNSKRILEKELGIKIDAFASPFGLTNGTIEELIKEAGYKTARTTLRGVFHNKDSIYHLSGILVDDSFENFVAELKRSR